MSDSKDTDAAAMPAAPAAEASASEQQISLALPEPAAIEPPVKAAAPASEAAKLIERAGIIEMPKPVEPVVPVMHPGHTERQFEERDAAAVHQVVEAAFADWHPRRKSYQEWARLNIERET